MYSMNPPRLVQLKPSENRLTARKTTQLDYLVLDNNDLIEEQNVLKGILHITYHYYLTNEIIDKYDLIVYNGTILPFVHFPITIETDGTSVRIANRSVTDLLLVDEEKKIRMPKKSSIIVVGLVGLNSWEVFG